MSEQVTTSPYNLMTPAAQANPYPVYQQLQRDAPIHWQEPFNAWFVTRYGDIRPLLQHPDMVSISQMKQQARQEQIPEATREKLLTIGEFIRHWLVVAPPSDHRRLRQLFNKGFTPRLVKALQPRIQTIADDLIDDFIDQEAVDLIEAFAYPLPAIVIAEMLGFPSSDRPLFKNVVEKNVCIF